jgi:hypothetical protein
MNRNKTTKKIAKEKLGIETLTSRKRDSLDFHELSVWQVKDALETAFEAGRKEAALEEEDDLYKWDDINKAMMETGHSAPQIARFLCTLTNIRKGA